MYATLPIRATDSLDRRATPDSSVATPPSKPQQPYTSAQYAADTGRSLTDSPAMTDPPPVNRTHEHADTSTHDTLTHETPMVMRRPRGKRPESAADSLGSSSVSSPPTELPSLARNRSGRHPIPVISPYPSEEEVRERELKTKTVGFFLAKIALSLDEGIKLFHFADKRNWGPDEFEQVRALEACLDEARRDFQELPQLLNGPHYYPNDRTRASLVELANLHDRLEDHIEVFRLWTRQGGPISPLWINETKAIATVLHAAQCHTARRIFESKNESTSRCLGAFLVHRQQRAWAGRREDPTDPAYQRHCLQEIAACNTVGRFERFGERDVAFVCNFCDGYIVWDDLAEMPSKRSLIDGPMAGKQPESSKQGRDVVLPQHRTRNGSDSSAGGDAEDPLVPGTGMPHWQAMGFSMSEREEKAIVFAAVAIANHVAPVGVEWHARFVCRYCEDMEEGEKQVAGGEDDLEPIVEDLGGGFADLKEFQEHLEWYHTSYGVEVDGILPKGTDSCSVM